MRREGRPQVHNIFVPKKNKLYSFEYLIYKFIRNPLIHEGSQLKIKEEEYEVCIDWQSLPNGIKVDSENNRVVLGGELVINILTDAVQSSM